MRPSATSDDATPNPNAHRRAEPGAARRVHWPACLARQGRPAVRRHLATRGRQSVRASGAAQCARPAAARRRDRRRPDRARAQTRCCAAALQLPFLDRIVLRAPSAAALPTSHPAQDKIKAATAERGLRLRRRDLFAAGDGPRRAGRGRDRFAPARIFSLRSDRARRIAPGCKRPELGIIPISCSRGPARLAQSESLGL